MIKVDISNVWGQFSLPDLLATEKEVFAAHQMLTEGSGEGNDFLGWLNLPTEEETDEIRRIRAAAKRIRETSDVFVVIGIGGSYLGPRAAIELMQGCNYNLGKGKGNPQVFFAGNGLSTRARNVLQRLLENGHFGEVFCDLNIRPPYYDAESVERCLQYATILKASREELPAVTQLLYGESLEVETAVERICADYPNIRLCLVTLDSDGALVYDTATGKTYRREAKPVEVVSSVGAGDSFGAAFLATYLRAGDVETALQKAVEVSAFVVAHKEAVPQGD